MKEALTLPQEDNRHETAVPDADNSTESDAMIKDKNG